MKKTDYWHLYPTTPLKAFPKEYGVKIIADRVSVCMGDDMEAHELRITIDGRWTMEVFLHWMLGLGNLPDGYRWKLMLEGHGKSIKADFPSDWTVSYVVKTYGTNHFMLYYER